MRGSGVRIPLAAPVLYSPACADRPKWPVFSHQASADLRGQPLDAVKNVGSSTRTTKSSPTDGLDGHRASQCQALQPVGKAVSQLWMAPRPARRLAHRLDGAQRRIGSYPPIDIKIVRQGRRSKISSCAAARPRRAGHKVGYGALGVTAAMQRAGAMLPFWPPCSVNFSTPDSFANPRSSRSCRSSSLEAKAHHRSAPKLRPKRWQASAKVASDEAKEMRTCPSKPKALPGTLATSPCSSR